MATWFARQSSVNIDTANMWNSAADGSGSWLTWASLGATDVLVANGFTAIAINVDFTCATITNAATGGTAGGQFTVTTASANRNITANVVGQDSGTATANGCLYATLHATNRLTITGNVTGGGVAAARGLTVITTNGLLTVTGTVTGGTNATAYGIASSSSVILMTIGAATGGTTGTVTAAYGILENASASATITVSGALSSPANCQAAISTLGTVIMGSGASLVSNGTSWMFPVSGRIKWETTDTGMSITLYDASAGAHILKVPDYPAVGTVADGVQFDYTALEGTRIDPAAADVRYGVQYANPSALTTGLIEMPNSGTPTGTQDATSDACVVSGKKYGSPQRTGSASGGGGGARIIGG